jgi:YD repeat-containing protein
VTYDGLGRPIVTAHPNGSTSQVGYDLLGAPTWTATYAADAPYAPPVFGASGLVAGAFATYDAAGRLQQVDVMHFDESGVAVGDGLATTQYIDDAVTARTITIDDQGHETVVQRDGAGREIRTVLPTGDEIRTVYLDGGATIRKIWTAPTADGLLSQDVHMTAWGAPSSITTDELGATTVLGSYVYDVHGRPIGGVDAAGLVRELTYDGLGRPRTTRTIYDGAGTEELVELAWNRNDLVTQRTSLAGGAPAVTT